MGFSSQSSTERALQCLLFTSPVLSLAQQSLSLVLLIIAMLVVLSPEDFMGDSLGGDYLLARGLSLAKSLPCAWTYFHSLAMESLGGGRQPR